MTDIIFDLTFQKALNLIVWGRNKVFCLTSHLWCWRKSHCSSPFATKDFGGAVSPLFDPAFARSFPYFSFKDVADLQKSTLFTLILFNSFHRKCRHLFPSCSQHPWNPKQNKIYIFAKSQHSKTVCYYVTSELQNESTLYSCLNFKELLARKKHHKWSLSDRNGIRTHNHLVRKRTLNHLPKLIQFG